MKGKQHPARQHQPFVSQMLGSLVDLDARLRRNPPARIADIGCGAGWSSVGMAKAYPQVRVDGFDSDRDSIEQAWARARQEKLTDRITFHVREVGDGVLNGRYDLVAVFGCVLDKENPVAVLATMRRLAGESGTVLVVDRRSAQTLRPYVLAAGFGELETLAIENDTLPFYRLHQ